MDDWEDWYFDEYEDWLRDLDGMLVHPSDAVYDDE